MKHRPIIPALGMLWEGDPCEFETSLVYGVTKSQKAWSMESKSNKTKQNTKPNKLKLKPKNKTKRKGKIDRQITTTTKTPKITKQKPKDKQGCIHCHPKYY